MEMVNLGKEEDYKKQNNLKNEIISFLLNSYTDNFKNSLHIYKNLLKGLLPEKKENIWKLEMIKYELEKIEHQHDLKNIFCVKFSDPDTDSCEVTVQS